LHASQGFVAAHAVATPLPTTALAFAFSGDKMVVGGSDTAPTVPTVGELQRAGIDGMRHFLGALSGTPCVAIALANPISIPDGFQLAGLRALFFRVPEPLLVIGARAFQLVAWDRTHPH